MTANETQTVVATATAAAAPRPIAHGGETVALAYLVPDGADAQILNVEDLVAPLRDRPRRRAGTAVAIDSTSFVDYFNRHANDHSEVWADEAARAITGVLNTDTPDGAGWRDHRISLGLRHTPGWAAWARIDRQMLSQSDFAEFIEERAVDIVEPTSAHMLELAQTFKATTKVDFESTKRLKSGETSLEYREQSNAAAGKKGELAIPDLVVLGIAPFEGGNAYSVHARFRYRITDGNLLLGIVLTRPEDILRVAFNEVATEIADGISAPVWRGTPAEARA